MTLSLKNILFLGLGVLILLSLLFIGLNMWQNGQPTSSLTVVGKAEQEVIPDELNVQFLLEKKGQVQDLEKMNLELDNQTKTILEYLQSQNIKTENIQTNKNSYTDYALPEREIASQPTQNLRNISVNFNLKFENYTENQTQINQIWQELLKKGVTNLNQNGFSISTANRQKVCEELQNLAIQNAWDKAQKQLKSLGGSKVVKRQIRNSGSSCDSNYSPMYMAKDARAEGGAATSALVPPAMAGKQKLEAASELQIDFR